MTLTPRETATVLAALRAWQGEIYVNPDDGQVYDEGGNLLTADGHFENETPLTPEEIDVLCERINCAFPCADRP